jgi:hypothetical protein
MRSKFTLNRPADMDDIFSVGDHVRVRGGATVCRIDKILNDNSDCPIRLKFPDRWQWAAASDLLFTRDSLSFFTARKDRI